MNQSRPSQMKASASGKTLLRNVIRHTDTHNRLREEAEMWQIYQKMKGENSPNHIKDQQRKDESQRDRQKARRRERRTSGGRETVAASTSTDMGNLDIQQSFLYDSRTSMAGHRCRGAAHMDEEAPGQGGGSTFWMRQLERTEAQDPDRWGHSGYRELYPDDFDSGKSEEDRKDAKRHRDRSTKRKRKREKDVSPEKLKVRKRKLLKSGSGDKSRKREKRKRRASSSDSDSDSSDSHSSDQEVKDRKKKKEKKKKKRKKKSRRREPSSDSDSDGGKYKSSRRSKFVNEREV